MVVKIKFDNGDIVAHERIDSFRYFKENRQVKFVVGNSQNTVSMDSASVMIGTSIHDLDWPVYEFLSEYEKKQKASREAKEISNNKVCSSRDLDMECNNDKIAVSYFDSNNEEQIKEFTYPNVALDDGTPVYDFTTITIQTSEELRTKFIQDAINRVPEENRTDETLELIKVMLGLEEAKV